MSLSLAIAAELPTLRREAEALMVDSCTVTRAGVGPGTVNETTGAVTPPAPTTVYTGRCRVQVPQAVPSEQDAGGAPVAVQPTAVSLPVVGSEGVEVGDVVTITAATFDASLVGVTYVVRGLHRKTHATARRLRVEEAN